MAIKTNQEFIQRLGTIKSEAEQPNPSRQALASELMRLAAELYPTRTAGADLKDSLMDHDSEYILKLAEAIAAGIHQNLKADGVKIRRGASATYFDLMARGYNSSDLAVEIRVEVSIDVGPDILASVTYKVPDSLSDELWPPEKRDFKISYTDPGQKLVQYVVKYLNGLV